MFFTFPNKANFVIFNIMLRDTYFCELSRGKYAVLGQSPLFYSILWQSYCLSQSPLSPSHCQLLAQIYVINEQLVDLIFFKLINLFDDRANFINNKSIVLQQ